MTQEAPRGRPRRHPEPSEPGWLSEILSRIGWTKHHLSETLGVDKNLPLRWDRGRHGIPSVVALWLQRLAAAHERLPPPPPERWQHR